MDDALQKFLTKDSSLTAVDAAEPKTARFSVATHLGYYRSNNEDNYFADEFGTSPVENSSLFHELSLKERRVFAVCDGMGGEDLGEEASLISVDTLAEFAPILKNALQSDLHDIVNKYASDANNRVCRMIKDRKLSHSGCTLALVCVDQRYVSIFNIGDSRVYTLRGDELAQVTEDQTLANKKIKANIYTEEEAKNSRDVHVITSFIGVDSREVGLKALSYKPIKTADITVLICSDGLTDMCCDEEIADILSEKIENHADALVDRALENGGVDNVTCVVISF